MGQIQITNMRFYTHNGVFAEEKTLGQQISVDVAVDYDIEHQVKDDDLTTTISYADVYDIIRDYVTQHDFNLMESVANGALTALLTAFPMAEKFDSQLKNIRFQLRVSLMILSSLWRAAMPKVYLSIGTNLGDRHANLQTAVDKLTELYPVLGVSKIYETQPVGEVVQDDFYNIALALDVPESLKPEALLTQTQQIEKEMKRVKTIHWGPRTIDLDILLFGELRMVSEQLTIPHAEMANRRFVLQPLLEVAERISDVTVVKQTQALLDKTADQNWVQPTPYDIAY